MSAIGNAMSSYTAQNIGAEKEERISQGYRMGCVLAVEENSIYCWRDLNRLQKDVAFLEDDFS